MISNPPNFLSFALLPNDVLHDALEHVDVLPCAHEFRPAHRPSRSRTGRDSQLALNSGVSDHRLVRGPRAVLIVAEIPNVLRHKRYCGHENLLHVGSNSDNSSSLRTLISSS